MRDTDGDGVDDGTETGRTEPIPSGASDTGVPFTGTDPEVFVPDRDPSTTTDPRDDDSDDDGLVDGTEDANQDGKVDGTIGDSTVPATGETNPQNPDTDGDGLLDGLEQGLEKPEGVDTDPTKFVADSDPDTTTDPRDTDTDDGTVADGVEDTNRNGRIDEGERDPNLMSDDVPVDRGEYIAEGGGGCAGGPVEDAWALTALGLGLALARRRGRDGQQSRRWRRC